MGKVIFNADDFGYSRAINYGIIDSHQYGILTSTTLMANMSGFDHAVELALKNPNLGVGVHLTLTCGKPLLNTHKTIVDETGYFKSLDFYETLDFSIDKKELYDEWKAQIDKVIAAKIKPTHLDSHHHTHTFGINQEVVIELAREYKLPIRNNMDLPKDIAGTERFEMNFDFVGRNSELRQKKYLENLMEDFRRYETIEIMCHPGYLDKEILEGSALMDGRAKTVNFLIHSNFSELLKKDKSIQLTNFNVLKK